MKIKKLFLIFSVLLFSMTCTTSVFAATSVKLKSISVSPKSIKLNVDEEKEFVVTALYSNKSKENVTDDCEYEFSKEDIVSIDSGIITGVSKGKTKITIKYESKKLTLSVEVKGTSVSIGQGNLKGAITWQYNYYVGTKPDVGAKIYLIPYNYKVGTLSEDYESSFAIGTPYEKYNLYVVEANGYGNYELNDINTGKYYLIICSEKTIRNISEPLEDDFMISEFIKPLFKDWDTVSLFMFGIDKYDISTITIEKGKTKDYSYDFGFTYL